MFQNFGYSGGIQKIINTTSLFDANFTIKSISTGFSIKISWRTPNTLDVLDWNGRIRILRKANEWPQGWNDPDATLIADETYTEASAREEINDNLAAGKIFYYTLFMQRTDEYWIEDPINNRGSAYAYDRWGNGDYLFSSLPKGWQIDDALEADNHLYKFLQIFGALADNIKTDAENLLTLMSVEDIHADLLEILDAKIGWPSWKDIGAIARRKETLAAVDTYKIFATDPGYEALIQNSSGWDAEVYDGWRYVMFSNGLYGSTTPDTTLPDLTAKIGTADDLLKYVNGPWHSVNGLFFEVTDVEGVSSELTTSIIARWFELIEFSKACYVDYALSVVPKASEESILPAIDTWEDTLLVRNIFLSNDFNSVTNNINDTTFDSGV